MSNEFLNEKHELTLKVLSPLHIGEGSEKDWVGGADFVQKNGKVYKLNLKKVLQEVDAGTIAGFLAERNSQGLLNTLPGKPEQYAEQIFDMQTSSPNPIKSFIKNGINNLPYVPGSSLKGAIRSVLFKYLRDGEDNDQDVFGSLKKGDDFMRFIKVSDVIFNSSTQLVNTKIFNLYGQKPHFQGGWKHTGGRQGRTDQNFSPTGFNTIYETLMPGERGKLTLAISPKAYNAIKEHPKKNKKDKMMQGGITDLFSIINRHSKTYIKKQIAFFEKYENKETPVIISHLKEILRQIPEDNSYGLLKMAAGSGFHSMTGDWQYEDYDKTGIWERGIHQGKKKVKSRKIAVSDDYTGLMGFVELRVLTSAEKEKIKQEEEQRKEEQRLLLQKEQEEKQRLLEEQQKAEALRLKQEEDAAREQKKKEEEEERKHKEFEAKLIKQKEEEIQRREQNILLKEQEKRSALEQGLKAQLEPINNYEQGEQIIKSYKSVVKEIPEKDYPAIEAFLKRTVDFAQMPKKQQKNWQNFKKGKWSLIRSWVSDDVAKRWFEAINNS